MTVFDLFSVSTYISDLYFSLAPQIWGVGGIFLAQVSIQILELIYECNFQMDTNAAPPWLEPAQSMNTAENYRNNSSKGGEVLYMSLYTSTVVLIVTN